MLVIVLLYINSFFMFAFGLALAVIQLSDKSANLGLASPIFALTGLAISQIARVLFVQGRQIKELEKRLSELTLKSE